CIVEEFIDFLSKTLYREDLNTLITEDEVWEAFVEATELPSEEQAALRDALEKHLAQEPTDEDDGPQKELQKKRFLEEFPELKRKLEEHIRKLRDLADHLDKVHKDCTISNVVADSTGTASGVLGILGLALAPITGGASLLLSATSLGLGAAAGVTSLTTTAVEESHRVSDEAEADQVVKASMDTLHDILVIIPKISVKLYTTGKDVDKARKLTRRQSLFLKMITDTYSLYCATRIVRGVNVAGGLLGASGLNLVRQLRFARAGLTSVTLGINVYNLVSSSKELNKGAKTEAAGALRDLAQKLQDKLQVIEQIHKALQSDLPQ
ncbi:hypothetical protein A6R68_09593, partial [Neotoma lepida]